MVLIAEIQRKIDSHDGDKSALERLPHLAQKVTLMWASRALDGYISTLIMDSRDGERKGLPMDVAAELMFLTETNKLVRAIDLMKKTNTNMGEAYRVVNEADHPSCVNDPWARSSISKDVAQIVKKTSRSVSHQLNTGKGTKSTGLLSRSLRFLFSHAD